MSAAGGPGASGAARSGAGSGSGASSITNLQAVRQALLTLRTGASGIRALLRLCVLYMFCTRQS